MKCQVCGAESGKYPLCRSCNQKRSTGEVIKCAKCNTWHYANAPCPFSTVEEPQCGPFLYKAKSSLVTKNELGYLNCIKSVLPDGYQVHVQANLASFISRTDGAKFQNELYRNVDFLITNLSYQPLIAIEINDQTHLTQERRERDKKVLQICEEAGIPMIRLWTSYGVNPDYIQKRITETIASLPVKRISHFSKEIKTDVPNATSFLSPQKKGCYIATCVYGSYDCPQVWTLRRYRDQYLATTLHGKLFIKLYYALSPFFVKILGKRKFFKAFWKRALDSFIVKLNQQGIPGIPYKDSAE